MDALHGVRSKPLGRATPISQHVLAASIIVAIVMGALGSVAYSNYSTAQKWKERAELARIDVQRLSQQRDRLETDLSTVKVALKSSEKDVAQLEGRMSKMADEKAQVEDEREDVKAYAERLGEIAVAYDLVATQFQTCRTESSQFTGMIVDADYYYNTGQWYLVTDQSIRSDAACAEAEGFLNELRNYVDALLA